MLIILIHELRTTDGGGDSPKITVLSYGLVACALLALLVALLVLFRSLFYFLCSLLCI